jgi:hypothetical protein
VTWLGRAVGEDWFQYTKRLARRADCYIARGGPGGSMGTKVVRLDGMTARRKRLKRKHGPSMSFDELVQKLWQPESGALEHKIAKAKQKKPVGRRGRIRKN